jgi:hypothetical protein
MELYKKVDPLEKLPELKETVFFKPKNGILSTGSRIDPISCIRSNQYNQTPNYNYHYDDVEYWLKKL